MSTPDPDPPAKDPRAKVRIQFDLKTDAHRALEELRRRRHKQTVAGVIREALQFLHRVTEEQRHGGELYIKDRDGQFRPANLIHF